MSEIRKVETDMELLEKVLSKENLNKAYKQVYKNKGASGVDGITVDELLLYIQEHKEEIATGVKDFVSNPKESIGKAFNEVGDYVKSHGEQIDRENIASHHQPENEMKAEKVHETASISQGATVGVSQNNSAPTIKKDDLDSIKQGDANATGKVENLAQNVGSATNQKLGELSNSISSIDQLFGGDGNTFALGEMREGLGFAQQAANFAKDFSKGDFLSMGQDVLSFGQGLESQMGGGGNVLDDAMDLSFGRER